MNRRMKMMMTAVLVLVALSPMGCRSKSKIEPQVPVVENAAPPSKVRTPAPEVVVDRSKDDGIDWSDIDGLNRMAVQKGWLRDAFYAYDSHALSSEARSALADSARWLNENPKLSLIIEGHCDERGTEQYNLALGEKRANMAVDYLVGLGVRPERIAMVSYGKERPFVRGNGEESHALNRRAHLRITAVSN